MADNKKSVLLYCDLIHTVEKLTNSQAGKLFKHYLRYVNDLNPKSDDVLIELVFEPIKQSLKRDLKKWEQIKLKRSEAGKKSAKIRQQKQQVLTSVECVEQTSTNPTVSVSVSDSVSDSVNVKEIIDKSITYTKEDFLIDWNELRTKHLKKPSFLNSIQRDAMDNFKSLIGNYNREQFKEALVGLFKQNKMPNGNTTMQSNPRHFLSHFESYLTAYHDRNSALYGENKKEY